MARRTYRGRPHDRDRLVLVTEPADPAIADFSTRITLTRLHESLFLLLLEAGPSAGPWRGLGQVGYTRKGVAFAVGDSCPECDVTGGQGTIRVSHAGREYFVCCSACKDVFEADPGAILTEGAARAGPVPR